MTATALTEGTYTAVAEQAEAGGIEPPMKTAPVTFAVVTTPPSVTLEAIESPSKNTKPSFKGTSTEAGNVTVEIHSGSIGGPVVSEATGTASGGNWSSAAASPALADGEYTAAAVQRARLATVPARANRSPSWSTRSHRKSAWKGRRR